MPSSNARLGLIAAAIVGGVAGFGLLVLGGVLFFSSGAKTPPAAGSGETATPAETNHQPKGANNVPPGDSPLGKFDALAEAVKGNRRTPDEMYAYDFEYVRRHKWWSKALTKERLSQIIDEYIATNSGYGFWVSRDGKSAARERFVDGRYIIPESLSKVKYTDLTYTITSGSKRPDAQSAIYAFISILDDAEYKNGPGR